MMPNSFPFLTLSLFFFFLFFYLYSVSIHSPLRFQFDIKQQIWL